MSENEYPKKGERFQAIGHPELLMEADGEGGATVIEAPPPAGRIAWRVGEHFAKSRLGDPLAYVKVT